MEEKRFAHRSSNKHRASNDYFACALTIQRSRERVKADHRTSVQHNNRNKTKRN